VTIPPVNVNVYRPALSVVVCATCWKVDWPDGSLQSATVAPATGGVRPPEITTFRPAVEGSGEEAIVSAPPGGHGVAQQGVCAQHVVGGQQVTVGGQQVVVGGQQAVGTGQQAAPTGTGQQGTSRGLLIAPFVPFNGGTQQGGVTFGRDTGQRMWGTGSAAPAGLSIASTHSEAAKKVSDDGTIKRRIAENPASGYPDL
jgi:hypothetical protein